MIDKRDEQDLIEALLRAFPELGDSYREELTAYGDEFPGAYTVVGFVFRPRFRAELESGTVTDFLQRSARFFEDVCRTGNPETINVIWIKIFEWLLVRPSELRLLWPEFGQATKAALRDAATRWNCLSSLPG